MIDPIDRSVGRSGSDVYLRLLLEKFSNLGDGIRDLWLRHLEGRTLRRLWQLWLHSGLRSLGCRRSSHFNRMEEDVANALGIAPNSKYTRNTRNMTRFLKIIKC